MVVNGKAIAADIYREVENMISHLTVRPHLSVFTCAPNFETQKFLRLKKKCAESVGIGINVIEIPESVSTEEVRISLLHSLMQTDGVVVQLPFPAHIDIQLILNEIPASYDVDALHYDGTSIDVLPPVIGAIAEISTRHDVLFAAQKVVIVGHGRLVGQPAEVWAQKQGAQVTVVTKETKDADALIAAADILILGAGHPGLITPEKVKEGVVIFDAGTSEEAGELKGDVDPAVVEKASLFTPVPGGIGPITIAVLLRNLVYLTQKHS